MSFLSVGTPRGKRLRTLSSVFKAFGSVLILAFAVIETCSVLGIDIAPLVASAGIVGLAIGFGSQQLVRDVVTSFFILAEDQFSEGDDVDIAGKRGIVEHVGFRTIYLRDSEGIQHIIPAGSIAAVTNYSKQKKIVKKKKES